MPRSGCLGLPAAPTVLLEEVANRSLCDFLLRGPCGLHGSRAGLYGWPTWAPPGGTGGTLPNFQSAIQPESDALDETLCNFQWVLKF